MCFWYLYLNKVLKPNDHDLRPLWLLLWLLSTVAMWTPMRTVLVPYLRHRRWTATGRCRPRLPLGALFLRQPLRQSVPLSLSQCCGRSREISRRNMLWDRSFLFLFLLRILFYCILITCTYLSSGITFKFLGFLCMFKRSLPTWGAPCKLSLKSERWALRSKSGCSQTFQTVNMFRKRSPASKSSIRWHLDSFDRRLWAVSISIFRIERRCLATVMILFNDWKYWIRRNKLYNLDGLERESQNNLISLGHWVESMYICKLNLNCLVKDLAEGGISSAPLIARQEEMEWG